LNQDQKRNWLESVMASPLSLQEILQSLDVLSDPERALVRQHLDRSSGSSSSEEPSALLATWDDSISLQDAEELNRIIRESRHSKMEPPRLELAE
jgi:hypothetical protein